MENKRFPTGDPECAFNNGEDCWVDEHDPEYSCYGIDLCPQGKRRDEPKQESSWGKALFEGIKKPSVPYRGEDMMKTVEYVNLFDGDPKPYDERLKIYTETCGEGDDIYIYITIEYYDEGWIVSIEDTISFPSKHLDALIGSLQIFRDGAEWK